MADGLDRLDERLCNLIDRFENLEVIAKQRHDEFRMECSRRFDWLENKLTERAAINDQHTDAMTARIASLETWRGYIMGIGGILVLLWGGLLVWFKGK